MMEDDITEAYVEKRRRDALASKFAQEIQTPTQNPHRDQIDGEDVEALAMAIERSTPDQVALWIKTLLDWACDENVYDDVTWGEGDKEEDGE
ncbi:MAG: hypothetical protein ABI700_22915, partial [Chloroflexota bacterium]